MLEELNVVTREHFMPIVTNQVFQGSPILEKIFGVSKEGSFGMATPSLDGRAIIEPLEIGSVNEEAATADVTDVSITKGSTTVTGTVSGGFTAAMANRGQISIFGGQTYRIDKIVDGTHLTITEPFEQDNLSGGTATITYYTTVANTSGAYGKADTFAAGDEDTLAGASYTWKMYHTTVKIHNVDLKQNAGKSRIIDLASQRLRSATKQLQRNLISDFYAATFDGSNKMIGLQAICAGSGIVGNINKAIYAWWQGARNTATTDRDLTWDILNDLYHKTKKYGNGDAANLIVTSDGVIAGYENNLTKVVVTGTSGERYENTLTTRTINDKVIDAGVTGFKFKGIDIVSDPMMPLAGKLFFLNLNYIYWRTLQAFQSTGWQDLKTSQNKDWVQLTINGYGALTTSACSKFGVASELNEE
ncbi:MAG TPA: phage major capsid protein [Bacilli bacterium]|nr:phage major capsid protein [Bacilli bacterium]